MYSIIIMCLVFHLMRGRRVCGFVNESFFVAYIISSSSSSIVSFACLAGWMCLRNIYIYIYIYIRKYAEMCADSNRQYVIFEKMCDFVRCAMKCFRKYILLCIAQHDGSYSYQRR